MAPKKEARDGFPTNKGTGQLIFSSQRTAGNQGGEKQLEGNGGQ